MNNETLLDKAVQNLNCATIIFNSNLVQDEVYLNYVGYHLQQAVELSIKYTLENNGVEYNKTHDIEQLIQFANYNGVDLLLTEYIYEKAEMFSIWEAKTRYIKNYRLEKNKVATALNEVKQYIDELVRQNEICVEKDNTITDDYDDYNY